MKKITLALSAMLTVSAAFAGALDYGTSYVLVPADATTQASGKYLTANADGSVTYSNTFSAATLWEYNGYQDASWAVHEYLKNGDKYLSFDEGEHAALVAAEAPVFSAMSHDVEGAVYFFNKSNFGFPADGAAYLNAINLTGEPASSAACAYFAIAATAETTEAQIEAALFSKLYPNAKVIACAAVGARNKGYFMTVTDDGALTHNNTLDMKAVWNVTKTASGNVYIQNIGTGGYAYVQDGFKLSEQPVEVKMADSPLIYGAVGFNLNLDASTDGGNWLNALNTSNGFGTWSFDEGSSFFMFDYDSAATVEEYQTQVNTLRENGVVIKSALTPAANVMNASSIGRMYGDTYIDAIKNAEGAEAILAAKNEAIQAAINFAQQQMGEGFALYHNSKEMFFNYSADNASAPFQRSDELTADGLWVAEWIDSEAGEPAAQDDAVSFVTKSFKLLNVKSGKYTGPVNGLIDIPGVDAAEAAVYNLVVTDNGFAIGQKAPAGYYLSVHNGDNMSMVVWSQAVDYNSYWSFLSLPTLDQEEAYMDFGGEYTEDPMMWGKIYSSINSVDLIIPEGATATGLGEVVFGTPMDEYDFSEINDLKTWTGAEIAAIAPVKKEITTEVYDWETDEYITVTSTVNVVSLPLDPAWEYPATYVAKASKYIFAVTNEEGTFYSDLMSFNTEITVPMEPGDVPVTPAAGVVESIDKIIIGAPETDDDQPWYVIDEADENLTVTFNGEIAKTTDDTPIDFDGWTLDMDYNDWQNSCYLIPVNFTQAGKYVLTIPERMFGIEDGSLYNETKVVEWTVSESDGVLEINSVKVNGEEIYDLSGRKVAKANRGLYIINGKKTVK